MVGEVRAQPLEQQEQRHRTENGSPAACGSAKQGHDDCEERYLRIKDDGRLDIDPARSLNGADQCDERGRQHKERQLGAGEINARMGGHDLVVTDCLQRQSELAAVDEDRQQKCHDSQRQQLPEHMLRLQRQEDIAPERAGHIHLIPGDELADKFGKAKGENHEINACDAQRGKPDDKRQRRADKGRAQEHQRPGQNLAQHRDRIGPDTEEGDGGERNVTRRTREHRPGRGERRITQKADDDADAIGIEKEWGKRQQRGCGKADEKRDHLPLLAKMPSGRQSSTTRKSR